MRWPARPAMAPFLAAWYLALVLLGNTATDPTRFPDLLGTLLYSTLTALVAWVASGSGTSNATHRALLAMLFVLWAALFGTARLLVGPQLPELIANGPGLLVAWTVPFVVLGAAVRRARTASPALIRGLTAGLGLLLLMQGVTTLRRAVREPRAASAANAPAPDRRGPDRPDIYIIVVDMFSAPGAMRDHYGVDLTRFTDSLRALGFVLPSRARTNYVHTGLVLPTLLNWEYVHVNLESGSGPPWDETTRRIEHARLWPLLRSHGYRIAMFPTGYPGTATGPEAAMLLRAPERPRAGFGRTWIYHSPLDLLARARCGTGSCVAAADFPIPVETSDAMRWKLETLATLPDSSGPVAAFMHFMGSHEPYIFNADCSARTPWWPRAVNGADSLEIRQAYGDQIACVATLLLRAVTSLLERAEIPPVVVLQSDHGNGGIRIDATQARTVTLHDATPRQRRERLEVFAAYHIPGINSLPDSITPVNVLPTVLNATLGTTIPTLPDRSFWSTWQRPLDLTEVEWLPDGAVVARP